PLIAFRLQQVQRGAIQDQHLPVVRLHERVTADAKRHVPELQRHRLIEQRRVRKQLSDAAGELIARPPRLTTAKTQPPQQAAARRLDGQQEILQAREIQL